LAQGFDVNIAGHAAGGPSSFLGTANYAGSNTIFNVPGLEAYHGTNTFLTEALTLEANKAMTKAVADGTPFFLHMSHYAVHVPLAEDVRFSAKYPTLDATERRYATMVEGMDKSLGDIRTKLEQLSVAENTLIIFYSDNGGHRRRLHTRRGGGTHRNRPARSIQRIQRADWSRWPGLGAHMAIPTAAEPARQTFHALTPPGATTRFFKVFLEQP
jgi:arylsulfatase A-like enzyme